jgi:hypothetical protein
MFRIRAIVTLALLIAAIYAFTPIERTRRWLDKLRELSKALAIAMVLYWVYLFALFFLRDR